MHISTLTYKANFAYQCALDPSPDIYRCRKCPCGCEAPNLGGMVVHSRANVLVYPKRAGIRATARNMVVEILYMLEEAGYHDVRLEPKDWDLSGIGNDNHREPDIHCLDPSIGSVRAFAGHPRLRENRLERTRGRQHPIHTHCTAGEESW